MPPDGPGDVENVLLVFTDQQRQDSPGCYGGAATPAVDGLAADGVRFDRAYTPIAICSPARASVVTGVRPSRHGIRRNVGEGTDLASGFPCYPGRLREAGYEAWLSGKWHLGDPPAAFGLDGAHYPGWFYPEDHDDYLAYLDARDLPRLTPDSLRDPVPAGGDGLAGALDTRPRAASFTSFVTERAIERIDASARADAPFYGSVHYYGPHNPYYLPEPYWSMYDPEDVCLPESAIRETFEGKPWVHGVQRDVSGLEDLPLAAWRRLIAAYRGYVSFIDDEVGRLLDALAARGLADSTAVVFASDHGGFVTAHRMHDKGPAMYEDIYRIPLIATGLGATGHVEERFASLLDLAPTFLDLAGAPIPDAYDGRSLLDLYRTGEDWRTDVLCEFHGHQFPYEQRMLRTDRYKLVRNQHDTAELYDLEADPHEVTNRIDDPAYGDVAARLHRRLRERLAAADDDYGDHASKLSGTVAVEPDDPGE